MTDRIELERLDDDPRPLAAPRLVAGEGEWRVRTGDHWVIYESSDQVPRRPWRRRADIAARSPDAADRPVTQQAVLTATRTTGGREQAGLRYALVVQSDDLAD